MEGFSKIDIFDTKGIEYILVIGYLVVLIVFWRLSHKQIKPGRQIQTVFSQLSANILRIPQGIFHSPNHTWTHLEISGAARVGISDLLQHITGEVTFSQLKTPGEQVQKGELLAELVQGEKNLRIYSPISGTVMNTNPALRESPELVNEDPYESGWIYKLKPSRWMAEISSCYLAEEAVQWSRSELDRFNDFLAMAARKYTAEPSLVILQDGGELRDNTLVQLPREIWNDFQKEFLSSPEKE